MKTGRYLRLQFSVCKVIDYANKLASCFLHKNENVHDTALACMFIQSWGRKSHDTGPLREKKH